MTKKGKAYPVVILIFILFCSGPQSWAGAFHLKDIVQFALSNSYESKNLNNQLQVAELKLSNSYAQFLPSLNLELSKSYEGGTPVRPAKDYPENLMLSLNGSLYDNGTRFVHYEKSKLDLRKNRIEWEKNRSNLCLILTKEFYQYSLASELLDIQIFQYELIEKQFKSIELQYQQGFKTRIDYVRFKSRLSRANLSMKQAKIVKEKSLEQIKKMMNWTQGSLQIARHRLSDSIIEIVPTVQPTLDLHFDKRIYDISRLMNERDIQLEIKKYDPNLYFQIGSQYFTSKYSDGLEALKDQAQLAWSAQIGIKWNLWDGGILKRNVTITGILVDTLNNEYESRLLALQTSITHLMLDIGQQKENFLLNKELVEMEYKNYQTLESSYRSGKTSFLDMINSLENLTSSKQSYVSDYFALKSLLAEYHFHEGNIYEVIGQL